MLSSGRGRNWRAAQSMPAPEPQSEEFAAPPMNNESNLDYYQEDMGGPDMGNDDVNNSGMQGSDMHGGPEMDVKMEGGEVSDASMMCVCLH